MLAVLLATALGGWLAWGKRSAKSAFSEVPAPVSKPLVAKPAQPLPGAPAVPKAAEPAVPVLPAPAPPELPTASEMELSPERRAQKAYDALIKFEGLAADDKKGREEKIQAFLEEHGDTIVSARARVLLQEMAAPKAATAQATPLAPAVSATPLAMLEGLVGHWSLDDGTGTTALDSSGQKNHGTLSNAPAWTSGKLGGALSFDGLNAHVQINNAASLEVGKNGTDFSVAFWMYLRKGATGAYRALLHKGNSHDERAIGIWLRESDNRIHYRLSTDASLSEGGDSNAAVGLHTWLHIAQVKSGKQLSLYLDGALDSQSALAGVSLSNSAPLDIGRDKKNSCIDGKLDDLRIYNRGLSAAEVSALAAVEPAGLVAHWKLDDRKGSRAEDASGSGHHGTLVYAPVWVEGKFGGALQFNGQDQHLVADGLEVDLKPGGKNTVAFWMNWSGGDSQMPFGWDKNYDLYLVGGFFGINTGIGDLLGIASEGLANKWVHLALVYPNGVPSAANAKMYINGVAQELVQRLGTSDRSVTATPLVFLSGWDATTKHKFGGLLDEVRIYRRELTAEEINALAKTKGTNAAVSAAPSVAAPEVRTPEAVGGQAGPERQAQAEAAWRALQ